MTFTITAWGPNGRGVYHLRGPIPEEILYGEDADEARKHVNHKYRHFSSLPVKTSGRVSARPDFSGDPSEARW